MKLDFANICIWNWKTKVKDKDENTKIHDNFTDWSKTGINFSRSQWKWKANNNDLLAYKFISNILNQISESTDCMKLIIMTTTYSS